MLSRYADLTRDDWSFRAQVGKVFGICAIAAVMNFALWGAEKGFTDFEAYLPVQPARKGIYSPARELERFRSQAQLDRAYRLIQGRQLDAAKGELLSLLQAYPENLRAHTVYLDLLQRLGDHSRIIEQASIVLRQQPLFIPALAHQSRAYTAMGRINEAIAVYEILARQPALLAVDRVHVLDTLGDVYIHAGRFELALSVSTQLLERQKSFRVWLRRGLALEGLNRLEGAEESYRQALALADDHSQRLRGLRAIAEICRKTKRWPAARKAIVDGLQIAPNDEMLLRSLADTEYQLQNYEQAAVHLRRLLDISQGAADREFLAGILMLQKDWNQAETQFKGLLSEPLEPARRARVYRALSQIAEAQGDAGRSADYLKHALETQPSAGDQEKLANLLIAQGKLAEGAAILHDLLSRVRNAADKYRLLLALGNVRLMESQFAMAADLFSKAVRIREDGAALAAASDAYERAGDFMAAIKYSRRDVAKAASVANLVRLGRLYEKVADWREAVASFEAAVGLTYDPAERAAIHRQVAFAWTRAANHEKARLAFERALALLGQDASLHRDMAETLTQLGRFSEAAAHLRAAVGNAGTVADRRALALAEERAGELESAISTYSDILPRLPRPSTEGQEVCVSLAALEARRGNPTVAARWWQEASEFAAGSRPEFLVSAARNLTLAERWEEAAGLYRRYLATESLSRQDFAHALESLAFLSLKTGDDAAAAGYFRRAVESGSASVAAYGNLGFALVRLGRWREALEAFLASPQSDTDVRAQLAIAQCYRGLDKPGLAIHALDLALSQDGDLSTAERRQAYADLGYLYAAENSHAEAIRAWQEAQRMEASPAIALGLARMKRLAGDVAGAHEELQRMDAEGLAGEQQAEYFDELAQAYAQQGNRQNSLKAWEAANRTHPSARRNYEIGLLHFTQGMADRAIPFFERAEKTSGQEFYLRTLAYAYKAAGRLDEAASCFSRLADTDSASASIYSELGYLEMRRGHSASAAQWFRKSIDSAGSDPSGALANDGSQRSQQGIIREDLARLTKRWDLTIYQGYDSAQPLLTASAPGTGAGTVVPQGGGFELGYQPPRIGFRNERTLQLVARFLWNNEPRSFGIRNGSEQMGLGLRYKPLASQNLQVSIERLIGLGNEMPQTWMARAMASWVSGFRIKPARRAWNYSLLYMDTAYLFPGARVASEYLQVRQGVTLRLGQSLLITPHAIATIRHQSPAAALGSYMEQGGGVSLRFFYGESTYSPATSSVELLGGCHRGTVLFQTGTPAFRGCRVATILRF